jgi:hypothetical protein
MRQGVSQARKVLELHAQPFLKLHQNLFIHKQ